MVFPRPAVPIFCSVSRVSEVTLGPFLVFFGYVLGTKLGAVADASQSYATCAWQARWPQNWKVSINFYNRVSEVTLSPFLVFFCYVWGHKAMQLVLGRLAFRHESRWCIAVADASQSYAACAWQARWKQNWEVSILSKFQFNFISILQFYSMVSEVTLGPFLVFFCYVLGTKLGAVLPLRMRHKAMQVVLGRLAGDKTEKSQFLSKFQLNFISILQLYSKVSEVTLGPFLVFFCYVLGTKLGAGLLLRMRHKAMQLVLGRLAGNKIEKSQFYQSFNSILFQFYNFIVGFQKWR